MVNESLFLQSGFRPALANPAVVAGLGPAGMMNRQMLNPMMQLHLQQQRTQADVSVLGAASDKVINLLQQVLANLQGLMLFDGMRNMLYPAFNTPQ